MLLKFGFCEFFYSNKEGVCIYYIEDGMVFIWFMELKVGEIDLNIF